MVRPTWSTLKISPLIKPVELFCLEQNVKREKVDADEWKWEGKTKKSNCEEQWNRRVLHLYILTSVDCQPSVFRPALHLSYCTVLWQWTTGFLYFLQSNLMSIFCAQGWRFSPLWGPDRCLTEWWMSLHPSIIGFSLFGLSLAACLPGGHLHLSIKFAPLPTGWPSDSYANAAAGFWLAAAWLA